MIEYTSILKKVNAFILNVLNDENPSPQLSFTEHDINLLACNQGKSNKDRASDDEHLVYSFENNRLFEEKSTYVWMLFKYKIIARKFEIVFIKRQVKDLLDREDESPRSRIIVNKLFINIKPPKDKLEEWLRNLKSDIVPGGFLYRYSFTKLLFNSDLDFTGEQIENALKKVTSVAIVEDRLIFYVNRSSNN
jgi:hypothetical protein